MRSVYVFPIPRILARLRVCTRASFGSASRQVRKRREVVDGAGDLGESRTNGVEIRLHPVDYPHLLVHQHPPTPGEPFELGIGFRHHGHLAQHVLGQRQLLAQREQLQHLAGIDGIALRRAREDLLVSSRASGY